MLSSYQFSRAKMEKGNRASRLAETLCSLPGMGWLGPKLVRKGIDPVLRFLGNRVEGGLRVLDESQGLHFKEEPSDPSSSEWIVWFFATQHRDVLYQILQGVRSRGSLDPKAAIDQSVRLLNGVQGEEMGVELRQRIEGVRDPIARAGLHYLLAERDANLELLIYLQREGLSDLDPKHVFEKLPALIGAVERARKEILRVVLGDTSSPVMRDVFDLALMMKGRSSALKQK